MPASHNLIRQGSPGAIHATASEKDFERALPAPLPSLTTIGDAVMFNRSARVSGSKTRPSGLMLDCRGTFWDELLSGLRSGKR